MLTSKKVILSKLYSEVNLIEGWNELGYEGIFQF